jgi:signal transduction histidine kinase
MSAVSKRPTLIFEEKKAIKLFLWLFYILYVTFDIFWYFLLPKFTTYDVVEFPDNGLGYWLYILIFSLLPISIYFIKKGNPYIVKYFFLVSYILIDLIDNFIKYVGTSKSFASGNIVDVLFVFFSPVFVNKKYFWAVSIGITGKYILTGIVLHSFNAIAPAIVIILLSAIAFILLIRFYSYINSLTSVYEELREKEKLAVIGQMAAAVGHEIRNPLSSLKGFTQLQHEKYPNTNDFYPIMIEEIDRIDSIVSDLMYIGKPKAINFGKASIIDIITYTISITKQQAEKQGVTVETNIEKSLMPIDCDEKRLKQVFINLIKNAIEAMPEGGKIKIHIMNSNENKISISIEDEGCGISTEVITNLGEPFNSTKKDGTGLGLMVTNQIIKDHNGELKIESILGKGTNVLVILPISQKKK